MAYKRAFLAIFLFRFALAAQTSPPIPANYQSLYTELQGDVTAFSQNMAGTSGVQYPTIFAGQVMTANSDIGSNLLQTGYYAGTVAPELQEIQALGVTAVTVHINFPVLYQPYFSDPQVFQNYVAFYQQLAQQIHASGMKMIVETSVASPENGANVANFLSYYQSLSWNDYMAGRAQQALTIAQSIQPDYLSVITEPDFEAQNSGQTSAGTPDGSLQELQTIQAAFQAANVTNVPIGAGAGTWIPSFSQYIQNFISAPVGYIDVHMNSVSNNFPQNALSAATMAQAAGIPVAMSEAWCKKISAVDMQSNPANLEGQTVDALDTFSFWEPLDQLFLQSLVTMAQTGQFLFVAPSWTGFFFGSLDYSQYGTQSASQVVASAQTAALNARQVGAFTALGPAWEGMILPTPDTTAPQVPAAPSTGQINQTFVQVLWGPSQDNVGVAGYNLYRNGALIYTSSQVNYNDSSLAANTTYSYQLQAFDAAGNLSALSAPTTVTTLLVEDTTPPSVPANVQGIAVANQQIQLTWSPSTDDFAIGGYEVFRGSSPTSLSPYAVSTNTWFTDSSVTANTTYYYAVESFDPSGNYSAQSNVVTVTSSSSSSGPGLVPAVYQSLYSELQGDIANFSQASAAASNGSSYPTTYSSQLLTANSNVGPTLIGSSYFNVAVMPELQELQALGVTAVSVNINFPILYEPYYGDQATYQSYVNFYQQVAQQIHSMGMKMIVETTVASAVAGTNGAGFLPYYQTLAWNDYMNGRAQQAVNIAQSLQPDFMSVITEPDSESQNSGQPNAGTPSGSLQELQTILAALQAANVTNVPVGAGAGTWINSFSTYIQNVLSTTASYVDVHLYSVSNAFPENTLAAAAMAHAAGVPIAMSETWCKKVSASQLQGLAGNLNDEAVDALGTFSFWEPLDQMFLQALVQMANAGQFQFVAPFWTDFYYSYLDFGQYGLQTPDQLMIAEQSASLSARQSASFSTVGPAWENMILPTPDTTAPLVPAAPTIGQYGQTQVQVLWTPTTDNVGVAGYNLYRNGTLINTSSQVNYVDSSAVAGTTYSYQVQAFDAQGNTSDLSAPVTVTTIAPPDNTPPAAPLNLQGTAMSDQQIQLSWSPSTDNVSIAGYRVFRGANAGSLSLFAVVTSASFTDSNLYPNTTYYYSIEAFDPSRNYSPMSATIGVTTLPDTTPPTAPTNVIASGTGYQQVNLSWTASTDDIRVAGYTIYRGKTASSMIAVGTVTTSTTFVDTTSLMPGTTYYYAVVAFDGALNNSAQSAMTTATTVADTQPPTVPQNVVATVAGMQQVNLTWSPSTDNVMVAGYNIYYGKTPSSMTLIGVSTTPSFNDTIGLIPGATYYFAVVAYDEVLNLSAQSAAVTATTTSDTQPPTVPQNLVATVAGMQQVNLTWSASTDNVSVAGYNIYYGKSASSLTLIGNTTNTSFSDTAYLTPGTTYYFAVAAYDEVLNASAQSPTVTATTVADTQPPTVPQNLVATVAGMQQVNLTWSASTDNVTVAGYYIYYGKSTSSMTLIGNTTNTSFSDTAYLTPGTTYYFAVAAYDEVLNASAQSPTVTATTVADTQPPTVPQNLVATAAGMQQVNLTWSASTDNVLVGGYYVYYGKSASSMTLIGNTTATSFTDTVGLMPGTTYYFAVAAYDEVLNVSAQSATVMATTAADTQPPTAPQNLVATAAGMQQVNLTWSASTDNVMVVQYKIYAGKSASSMALVGSSTTTSFTDTVGLMPGTAYYFAVTALDESSNTSAQSATATATTAADTQPPTVPQSLTATAGGMQQVNLSWSASTDNVVVNGYAIYRGTSASSMTLVGNTASTSFVDTASLRPGTLYYYAVAAFDESSNYSAQSGQVTVTTTADTQPPTVPQSLSVSGTSGTQINLTWTASTDNVAVYSYRVYRGASATSLTLIGASQTASYTDTSNLKAHQIYYYAVSAVDTSGNASAETSVVSITNP